MVSRETSATPYLDALARAAPGGELGELVAEHARKLRAIEDEPALGRRCRDCGAEIGEDCTDAQGRPAGYFHAGRF